MIAARGRGASQLLRPDRAPVLRAARRAAALAARAGRPMELEAERNAEARGARRCAWRELLEACRRADPEALEAEHTELFVGTGKAAVTPYLSHYVLRHSNDSPLVELARAADRLGNRAPRGRAGIRRPRQRRLRNNALRYCGAAAIDRGAADVLRSLRLPRRRAFCDAVSASQQARFYRPVARFARTFMEVEKSAFEMTG